MHIKHDVLQVFTFSKQSLCEIVLAVLNGPVIFQAYSIRYIGRKSFMGSFEKIRYFQFSTLTEYQTFLDET